MELRRVGRTDLHLSVVGFGTAQLQMLPERRAIETLVRGFELGVNWVHSAPDYGAVERWIQRAIERSRKDVMVLGTGPGQTALFETFFENACFLFKRDRLEMFGINCIDDIERLGENVWGPGGMVECLRRKRAEGRLGAIFCTTHGSPDYLAKLVTSGMFDAIMVAYNPLGFHLLTYDWSRDGRTAEDIAETRRRIFPLAARHGVSLIVMKALGGGLLSRGKAFPPHEWLPPDEVEMSAADVLRYVLAEPGVTAVVPGVGSPEEAEEDALAGHAPLDLPALRREAIERTAARMRLSICSRCAKCEPTCSKGLPISSMFRDAYIWNYRNETFMADDRENYFGLHPAATLACATCEDRTCECPQGIDVPLALGRIHRRVHAMATAGQHPGPPELFDRRTVRGPFPALVLTSDVTTSVQAGGRGAARFLVQNAGTGMWTALDHSSDPLTAVAVGVTLDGQLAARLPIRQNVSPAERSAIAVEFPAPAAPGTHDLRCYLMPLTAAAPGATPFHSGTLRVEPVPEYGARFIDHTIPPVSAAGRAWGVRVTVENTGRRVWSSAPASGHPVVAVVSVDASPGAVLRLPRAEVAPGEIVSLHFAFWAPAEIGPHQVRVALAREQIAWFADEGTAPLVTSLDVVAAEPPSKTDRALALSVKRNLWHYQPTSGISRSRDGRPFPLFVERAKGCKVWDPEGHEYLDYTMGWGSVLLGHADERVQASVREVLDTGSVVPLPYRLEMDVAELLAEDFPSAEMVVFGKNGSDACTVAARLARLETGKRVILSCGFHGWQDFGLAHFPFEASGIPGSADPSFYKFRFNDRRAFFELYFRHRPDLAAVMIEPSGPFGGDDIGPEPDADPVFLEILAQAAREAGALLIFDEIITGYRYPRQSVQRATGMTPDLTCLGKALASGFPLSALVGRARLFHDHFFKTHYCPTFKAELYSLAAAKAAIQIYRRERVAERVWAHGRAVAACLDALCRERGIAAACQGPPFRLALWFQGADPHLRRLKKTLFVQELLKNGVLTVSSVMLPSSAHTDAELDRVLVAASRALDMVADADRRHDYDRRIEIPLL